MLSCSFISTRRNFAVCQFMDRNLEEIHAEYPSNTGKEASNELSIKSS